MTKEGTGEALIVIQVWLPTAVRAARANTDFERFRDQLEKMDRLLGSAPMEALTMDHAVEGHEAASIRQRVVRKPFAVKFPRVQLLKAMLGNPYYRSFSRMVASSKLLADFCGVRRLDGIRGVAKNTLERTSSVSPKHRSGGCVKC